MERFAPLGDEDRLVLDEITSRTRQVAARTWWVTLVDKAILRERVVDLGRRPAEERVAHLLCELLVRLRAVGLAHGDAYELPVTQVELADSTGLSAVHVNRVLQALRGQGLIALHGKRLAVLDPDGLIAFGGFNPNYLHLGREPRRGEPDRADADFAPGRGETDGVKG